MQVSLEFPIRSHTIIDLYSELSHRECIAINKLTGVNTNDLYFVFANLDSAKCMEKYLQIVTNLAKNIRDQLAEHWPNTDPYKIAHNLLCRYPAWILLFYVNVIGDQEIEDLQLLHCQIITAPK